MRHAYAARPGAILALAILAAACASATPDQSVTTGSGPTDRPGTSLAPQPGTTPSDAVYRVLAEACGTGPEAVATGVAVAERHIVTVAHTFEGTSSVVVVAAAGADGERLPVDVVWLDRDRDLALLELEEGQAQWLPLGEASDGQPVTVLTATGDATEARAAEVLRVVDVTLDGNGERAGLELDAAIDPGDSGAPVVSDAGEVVGVVFATDRDERRGWAIAAAEIETALADRESGPVPLSC